MRFFFYLTATLLIYLNKIVDEYAIEQGITYTEVSEQERN